MIITSSNEKYKDVKFRAAAIFCNKYCLDFNTLNILKKNTS